MLAILRRLANQMDDALSIEGTLLAWLAAIGAILAVKEARAAPEGGLGAVTAALAAVF
ncbi:MAG: hypothetical protein LCH95_15490 [Proteobacteria bacterium]|nr:hypothetical protein [Pseudomonadota bacterium]